MHTNHACPGCRVCNPARIARESEALWAQMSVNAAKELRQPEWVRRAQERRLPAWARQGGK